MSDDRNIFQIFNIDENALSDDRLTEIVTKNIDVYENIDWDFDFHFSLSKLCGTKIKLLIKKDKSECLNEYTSIYHIEQIYESKMYYILLNIRSRYNSALNQSPLTNAGIECTKDILKRFKFVRKENTEEQIIRMCDYDSISGAKKYFIALSRGDIVKADRMFSKYLERQIITEDIRSEKYDSDDDIDNETNGEVEDDYLNNENKNIKDHIYE